MINGIDYQKFLDSFLMTDIGKSIEKDFDEIICNNHWSPLLSFREKSGLTFREIYGNSGYTVNGPTSISITTLYYLQFLLEKNPAQIYDIGCGWNIWKRYYPQIIGIDSNNLCADIIEKFDDNFVKKYENSLESIICVNLNVGITPGNHKYGQDPCTYENYIDQVKYLSRVLKPGGRAYFAISRHGMYNYTPDEWYIKNNVSKYDFEKLKKLLLEQVTSLPFKILSFDCELDILESIPAFDGCVRLVFEK